MRLSLALVLLMALACAEDATPPKPPQIDYKLQFEARTLEARLRELQQEFSAIQAMYAAKIEAMKQACGSGYEQTVDPKTTEYVCSPKPAQAESTRDPSGTWKGAGAGAGAVSPQPKK